jgi:hypothetical protein
LPEDITPSWFEFIQGSVPMRFFLYCLANHANTPLVKSFSDEQPLIGNYPAAKAFIFALI